MELTLLIASIIISLLALYYAYSSYIASLHQQRYQFYEETKLLLNDILHSNLSSFENTAPEFLFKTKSLMWRGRWLISNDSKIISKLNDLKLNLSTFIAFYSSSKDDGIDEAKNKVSNARSNLYELCADWLMHNLNDDFDQYLYLPIDGTFLYKTLKVLRLIRKPLT